MTVDQIMAEVRGMLTEIIGTEYALSLDIGMDTSFDADLELESIEFVKTRHDAQGPVRRPGRLRGFLADKELEEIIGLTVGDVVTYVAGCLTLAGAVDG